jgi:predicted enzyme related to lactoylglutathione lyase
VYAVNKIEINLAVPSIEETIEWYARVLGWSGGIDTYDTQGHGTFGDVVCGERIEDPSGKEPSMGFNLERFSGDPEVYRREQPHFSAFIKVDDVDAVYARVQASGTATDGPSQDQLWGGRLFSMVDLNGFHLIFYQMVEQLSIGELRERLEKGANRE